jgi:hypothetical protein
VRWGTQKGYCVVAGQKVPLERPRVRDVRPREVPLGSYETLQRGSLMEDAVVPSCWTAGASINSRLWLRWGSRFKAKSWFSACGKEH